MLLCISNAELMTEACGMIIESVVSSTFDLYTVPPDLGACQHTFYTPLITGFL